VTLYAHLVEMRRPQAIVGQSTEQMPAVPAAATGGGPAPAVDPVLGDDWTPAWGPLDLVAAAVALALGAGHGRHRHGRGCVRRRGIWRRPSVRVLAWDETREAAR